MVKPKYKQIVNMWPEKSGKKKMHKKNEAECEKAKLNKISHKIQKTHDVTSILEKWMAEGTM